MNDVAVALEHVDFLNLLDGLNIQLLEVRLQLLVVGTSGLVDLLDLASRSTLASVVDVLLVFRCAQYLPFDCFFFVLLTLLIDLKCFWESAYPINHIQY